MQSGWCLSADSESRLCERKLCDGVDSVGCKLLGVEVSQKVELAAGDVASADKLALISFLKTGGEQE